MQIQTEVGFGGVTNGNLTVADLTLPINNPLLTLAPPTTLPAGWIML